MIISFALNIQRLAHERIQRKVALRQQQQQLRKTARQDRLEETYGSRPPSAAGTGVADGEQDEGDEGTRYLHSTLWWTGLVLMIIGEAGNFVACTYPFYPLILPALSTIVAVMSSLLLVLITLQLFTLMLQGFDLRSWTDGRRIRTGEYCRSIGNGSNPVQRSHRTTSLPRGIPVKGLYRNSPRNRRSSNHRPQCKNPGRKGVFTPYKLSLLLRPFPCSSPFQIFKILADCYFCNDY